MFKLSAALFVVSALITPALVQATLYGPCGNVFQTTDKTGKQDAVGAVGTPCIPGTRPSGDCGLDDPDVTAVSATCQLTYYTRPRSYICCYAITEFTFSTPAPGATFSTLAEGLTLPPKVYPTYLKPRCPMGIPGSIVAKSNIVKTCNITQNTCGTGYTCRQAVNTVDVFGTVTTTDNLGAGVTPYLCCDSDAFTNFYKVFEKIGLYPSPMSWTTIKGIVSVKLGSKVAVSIGDDVSYMMNQLAKSPASITLQTATSASRRYHVYMFDSDNGKECMFMANIVGSGTTVLKLPDTTAAATAPQAWVQVYRSTQANALTLEVAAWKPTLFYLSPRRWVVIVWQTTADITINAANIRSSTNLNLKKGLYGDFEPSTAAATRGNYVNNTNILTKLKSVLKVPIAATYFFARW